MRPGFIFFYIIILGMTIIGALQPELHMLHSICKPLLMGTLIFCAALKWKWLSKSHLILLLLALAFSLAGDVFLLPEFQSDYFVLGLLSFLCAHVVYIVLFLKLPVRPLEVSFIRRNPWLIFLGILYGGWMYLQVKDGARDIAWVILLYILIILTMAITAFNRQGAVSPISYRLVVLGALLFMISDSVLAWNKFVDSLDSAPFYILSTYGIAQLLICHGILKQIDTRQD